MTTSIRVLCACALLTLLAGFGPAAGATRGIWISPAEVRALPMVGRPWSMMDSIAHHPTFGASSQQYPPDLKDQDKLHSPNVMAGALVWVRTGEAALRTKVRDHLRMAYHTMDTRAEMDIPHTMAWSRQLPAYVISADLIDLESFDPAFSDSFNVWLDILATAWFPASNSRWPTLNATHENGAAGWSGYALAARVAIDTYRNNSRDLARADSVYHALANRTMYPTFSQWISPPTQRYFEHTADWKDGWCGQTLSEWTAISPPGCSLFVSGAWRNMDGAQPENLSRGAIQWPPDSSSASSTTYSWSGTMEGVACASELLHRAGYPAYSYGNQMFKRMLQFMTRIGWPTVNTQGLWRPVPFLANYRYQTNFINDPLGGQYGVPGIRICAARNMGWTNWTHASTAPPPLADLVRPAPITDLTHGP